MKHLNFSLSTVIIIISILLGQQIISFSINNQLHKADFAEINHVKYGLFNVEEWKKQVNVILEEELNMLYLTTTTEYQFKIKIRALVKTLIDKIDDKIRDDNSNSAGGWIRQSFINIFLSPDDIKKGIPKYTDAIIHEMKKTKTREHIKIMLNRQLERYFKMTFGTRELSSLDNIVRRTESTDINNAKNRLSDTVFITNKLIFMESALLIFLTAVLFSLSAFNYESLTSSRYIFLVIALIILLVAGVTIPIIDMDIKISKFSFMLLGHPIDFHDQVLYFQSISILDIFMMLVSHSDLKVKLTGMLVAALTILLPVTKILSFAGYYFNYRNARKNQVIQFFITKSGRWFIEATMIISVFITYTIFNRVISSRFEHFNALNRDLVIFLRNDTYLQPGYYLYLTYAVLTILLARYISREQAVQVNNELQMNALKE